jgi:hypothetical protein
MHPRPAPDLHRPQRCCVWCKHPAMPARKTNLVHKSCGFRGRRVAGRFRSRLPFALAGEDLRYRLIPIGPAFLH